MKRFDTESKLARMLTGLRKDSNWPLILQKGTVGNVLKAIAESGAEDDRYMEQLYREKKWKTAMDFSSLEAQGDLLSYKRQLPNSAIGYVIVSHTDEEGKDRLSYYGSYYYDLDAESDYDDITKATTADESARHALVPWTCDKGYSIPKGTRFVTGSGVEFFSTEVVSSKTLKKKYSEMNDVDLEAFKSRGGWKGIKYLKIPVMQGIQKTVSIGRTTANSRFQSFVLPTLDVDAASNEVSCNYFSVYIQPQNGEPVIFTEIDKLSSASSIDNVFEKSILKDESGIKIKFGDGLSGAIPPEGIVYVKYVETLGSSGNINAKYQVNTMILPTGYKIKDPRTDTYATFLSCTNVCAISGGRDIEAVEDYKVNAPTSYLKSYTIATNKAYLNAIDKYSPLNLLHCKIFPDESITSEQVDTTIGEDVREEVANELNTISSNINITAMLSNGEEIPDEEVNDTFLNPLQTSIYDMKGPSDTIKFIQPNLIELVTSFKVTSSSYDYTEDEIAERIKEIIAEDYDIFNQDFNEPIYTSKLIALAKTYKFTDTVSVITEAVAKVDNDNIDTTYVSNMNDYIVSIPFNFDKVYMSDLINQGFKDCTVNADYLLKVDLEFINDSTKTNKNRTFFLYDNRIDESGATTIFDAKTKLLDGTTSEYVTQSNEIDYTMYDKAGTDFDSLQCRVAQFDTIDRITDAAYMKQLKDFSKAPTEIRPYETLSNGTYKEYSSSTDDYIVEVDSRYYKQNTKFVNGVDIDFNMNQDEKTLTGTFYIPLSYFEFSSIKNFDKDNDMEKLRSLIKQYVNLRVYAQPKIQDIAPQNINDIIYVDKDYIKVEKVQTN